MLVKKLLGWESVTSAARLPGRETQPTGFPVSWNLFLVCRSSALHVAAKEHCWGLRWFSNHREVGYTLWVGGGNDLGIKAKKKRGKPDSLISLVVFLPSCYIWAICWIIWITFLLLDWVGKNKPFLRILPSYWFVWFAAFQFRMLLKLTSQIYLGWICTMTSFLLSHLQWCIRSAVFQTISHIDQIWIHKIKIPAGTSWSFSNCHPAYHVHETYLN